MAWTFVQSASAASNAVSLTGVTAGNLIVFYVKYEGATASGDITASDGTTGLTAGTHAYNADLGGQAFYLLSANSGNKTYTATFGVAKTFYSCCIMEWAPGGTASFDSQNTSSGNGTTIATGNITTTGSTILAIGAHGNYNGQTSSAELIAGSAAAQVVRQGSNGSSMWASPGSLSAQGGACTITGTDWVGNIISFSVESGPGSGSDVSSVGVSESSSNLIRVTVPEETA